ncbi:MAG: PD-(D/E)XK nuclease family protein [Bacteroidaceae bacterium]
MDTFLKRVARHLTELHADPARTALVFPNKRAGLFFSEALAQTASAPVWTPAYLSISDLFGSLSALHKADPLQLVCELYRAFRAETGSQETLDDFYFWGERLIADFDDVDKNLVDADRLFTNLKDLKDLSAGFDFLDEEQAEALRQFFHHFAPERRTELKDRFTALWQHLGPIYHRLREALARRGLAYEGMLCRDAIGRLRPDELPFDTYAFVGFNVLNRVETRLFESLQKAGKALFYWDYDHYYLRPGHEAGEFVRQNLRDFPNALPDEGFDAFARPKRVRIVAAPTEHAQASFLPGWIRRSLTEREQETAVVLCDEALLPAVLHQIPPEVGHVNVTMGYPLAQTPVCGLLNALLDVQAGYDDATGRFAYASAVALLAHPYVRLLTPVAEAVERDLRLHNRFYPSPAELQRDEALCLLFAPHHGLKDVCAWLSEVLERVGRAFGRVDDADADAFGPLYRESLFKAYTAVGRFCSLVEEGELDVSVGTFRRLFGRVMAGESVPFHGEPAVGLQVMGLLETRNLDFRRLVLLSVGEGQLPKAGADASFVPYNLRKAFGMTTLERRNAVFAYYFYRLLQRAEEVTLLYNASAGGPNRGEWSRFLLQLLVESPHEVVRESLEAGQAPRTPLLTRVDKTADVMRRLHDRFDRALNPHACFSPSALNRYLDCRLRFYFQYVAGLKPLDEVSPEIDSALFGRIFHRSAERVYQDLTAHGRLVRKEDLEALLRDEHRLQDYVDASFRELFFQAGPDERPEYNGIQLVHRAVVTSYLRQLLRHDAAYVPFTMEATEQRVEEDIDIRTPYGVVRSRIGGIIDRMDGKGATLRIVDYKTGGQPKACVDVDSLFEPSDKRPGYVFQTFLYAAIVQRMRPQARIAPALLYIHRAASETYSPVIEMGEPRHKEPVEDFARHEADFRRRLDALLGEVFDPAVPFTQTEHTDICAYCDFRTFCGR